MLERTEGISEEINLEGFEKKSKPSFL